MEFLFYANYKNICAILAGCINTTKPTDSSFMRQARKGFSCKSQYTLLCFLVFQTILKGHIIFFDAPSFSSLSSTSFIFVSIYSSTTSMLLNVCLYFLNFLYNQPDIQYCALCKLDCL